MSLLEDIEKEIKKKKGKEPTKLEILKSVEDEIKLMIENKIAIKKQIELLIKNGIIDSIDIKYYRNVLIKHFGLKVKKRNNKTTTTSFKKNKVKAEVAKINPATSAKEILSQEVRLI